MVEDEAFLFSMSVCFIFIYKFTFDIVTQPMSKKQTSKIFHKEDFTQQATTSKLSASKNQI